MKSVKKKKQLENKKQLSTFPALTHLPLWGLKWLFLQLFAFSFKKENITVDPWTAQTGEAGKPTFQAVKNLHVTLQSALLILGSAFVDSTNCRLCSTVIFIWKNSACKWTLAFQTHSVLASTLYSVLLLYLPSRKQWTPIIFSTGPL